MKICNIGWANSIHVERWLRWFSRHGHEIHLITDRPKDIEGVSIHDIGFKPDTRSRLQRYKNLSFNIWWWAYFIKILEVRRLVRQIKPDILHLHSLWYPGHLGAFAGFQPYVVTVLDGDILWQKKKSLISRTFVQIALRRASMVFGESKQLLAECRCFGVLSDRLCLSHAGGVDLEKYNVSLDRSAVRLQLGLPREHIVLSPRSLGSIYNLKTVLRSIPIVLQSVPQAKFVFIWHSGTTQELEDMKQLTRELGIQDSTLFVGQITENNVALYHRAADVFISVALNDSGPKALKEAMACGAAPVVSDLASVREWITNGENGFIVEPTNIKQIAHAIVTLLLDSGRRERFARINVALARQYFDERTVMNDMEKAYYSVLEQPKERKG